MRRDFKLDLYLVTDRNLMLGRNILDLVEDAVRGGVTIVQLREKECSIEEFVSMGIQLKAVLRQYKIPLIINDSLEVALTVKADGMHIGQSDIHYPLVRKLLGDKAIIGLSVESIEDVLAAEKYDVDYLGVSPIFFTPTKTDLKQEFGLEGLRKVKEMTKHRLVAIGGVNTNNAYQVIRSGAEGIAVVSAICSASNPENAARELMEIVKTAKQRVS